jgi:YVTN family beta-propeller protein
MQTSITRALFAATTAGALTVLGLFAGAGVAGASATQPANGPPASARDAAASAAPRSPAWTCLKPDAFVANFGSTTVTPFSTTSGKASKAITVGSNPNFISITRDGKTAYVTNYGSGTVTAIQIATCTVGKAIKVGRNPVWIAITPNGKTAYVVNEGSDSVTPFSIATGKPGTAITVGTYPVEIAITPNGKTAYVTNESSDSVTPINLATNTALPTITVGNAPYPLKITPNGKTVYIANSGSDTVTPINTATNTAGSPITVGNGPDGVIITPDGKTAYTINGDGDTVTPINTATNTAGTAITVGNSPGASAVTPNGETLYVCNRGPGTVTPIRVATNTAGEAIKVGSDPSAIAITPNSKITYVTSFGSDTVTPIQTATNTAAKAIRTGRSPIDVAIVPRPLTVQYPAPLGRVLDSWAYDPAQHDIVLFGGDAGHGAPSTGPLYGRTWTWNGKSWTRLHPATAPSPRAGAALVWDPATHQLLLFGGGTFPDSYHFFGDTWTWNGSTWARLHPASSPSPRENPDMFYDATLREVILFGGNAPTDSPHYANHYDNQTWAWTGTTWTRLHPAVSPSSRDSGSLVYDPATRTAIMYGGYNDTGRLSDTWSFNGQTWTQLHPAHSPGADSPVWQAAYDSASQQLVLYGGDLGLAGPYSQSTWTWSGSTWTRLHPASNAGPRGYGAMTYDQATRSIVLFGGSNGTTDPRGLWEWNGTTWQISK